MRFEQNQPTGSFWNYQGLLRGSNFLYFHNMKMEGRFRVIEEAGSNVCFRELREALSAECDHCCVKRFNGEKGRFVWKIS